MARRRAFLAGLGTTGLLVALALLLLAVVGALLAFHGWPGSGGVGSAEGVSLDDKRLVTVAPPSFAAAADPATRAATARNRRTGRRSRDGRSAARQEVAGVRRTLRAGGSGGDGPAIPAPGLPSGPSRPAPAGAENVADAVNGVAGGAEDGIGNTAAPVGHLVEDTGNAVSETVRELGSKVKAETKQP
jgi:hypothetical protein